MAINRTAPLEERIQSIRAEIEAFIESKVEAERKRLPGMPATVLRHGITGGIGCQCTSYLTLKAEDEKAAAHGSAA